MTGLAEPPDVVVQDIGALVQAASVAFGNPPVLKCVFAERIQNPRCCCYTPAGRPEVGEFRLQGMVCRGICPQDVDVVDEKEPGVVAGVFPGIARGFLFLVPGDADLV